LKSSLKTQPLEGGTYFSSKWTATFQRILLLPDGCSTLKVCFKNRVELGIKSQISIAFIYLLTYN
jgi:hypothetical protein